ncbi:MAG: MlaD family protein [Phascolarctobacterium sp.]|uniref:MlaD family protein n=1 Tax=Phascolarctobacterium sp. TaxID=2049039 RepID=UPI0026DB003B|nr:MlaD family protein [Phascolarctobacterium sp.]MDO4921722.1 MlaD family protein [Phascolarctobacterium sp.]
MGSSEVKVGAFALGGAVVLAGIITFMGAFSFGKKGYELRIDYPQVSGLMPGHVVRYAGVQVGTVKELKVAPDKVEVIAEIDDNIKIPQGSVFSIAADGIMGEKYVNVAPPLKMGQGFITEGSTIKGVPGGGMDEFFANSGDLVTRLENIAGAFENIFGDKEVQESMKDGFKNMRDISENMNTFTKVMADVAVANQQDISRMIQQMSELSQHMNGTVSHIESIMDGVDNNGQTGRNIAAIVANIEQTSERMENIVQMLESVAQDPVTQQSLKDTLVNVKETSAKANKILGTLTEAKISADAGYAAKGGDWRGNLGVTLRPGNEAFVYMGGYDIGEANKFDFIVGRQLGNAGVSMGAMQGEFGVGLSYDVGRDFKLYSQLYDFDDAKVRVGGELRLTDSFSLYGETMDVRGSKRDTYMGVRTYF